MRVLNREDFVFIDYFCVCLEYFIFGWYSDDLVDENYVFIIFLYKEKLVNVERENRVVRRNI